MQYMNEGAVAAMFRWLRLYAVGLHFYKTARLANRRTPFSSNLNRNSGRSFSKAKEKCLKYHGERNTPGHCSDAKFSERFRARTRLDAQHRQRNNRSRHGSGHRRGV